MVRLMKVTKRGNQAYDIALEAAKTVLAGVVASLAAGEQVEQTESFLDEDYWYEAKVAKPKENTASRAGSYQLKRQKRGSKTKVGSRNPHAVRNIIFCV